MPRVNPLADPPATDPEDLELVRRVQAGSREALERLAERHQPWIYNIVLRMIWHPQDAEDATQEILIKLLTKLSTFEGRSSFRTWLYRIAINHALNMKRKRLEEESQPFEVYARDLDETPELDLPDPAAVPADVQLLVQEAKIGCTSGMLLCLDREQRIVYILGEILGVTDRVGAELLDVSRDNYRQKLARARKDLHHFMDRQCGLVNAANPCRCAKKTQGFIKAGYIDPANLLFARARVTRVREVAEKRSEDLEALDASYAEIHRDHPFAAGPDVVAALRRLLARPEFQALLRAEDTCGSDS
jgi:RNA polymerase sigma factor (sigma-70 family)